MFRCLFLITMLLLQYLWLTAGQPNVPPDSLFAGKQGARPEMFIPPAYTPLDSAQADLNADGREDLLLILRRYDEILAADSAPPRLLLLLIRQADSSLLLQNLNANAIMPHNEGGISFSEPFTGIEVTDSTFTLTHYGGMGTGQWELLTTFIYNGAAQNWFLHKVVEHFISTIDALPGNGGKGNQPKIYEPVLDEYTPNDFGIIPLSEYAYTMHFSKKN